MKIDDKTVNDLAHLARLEFEAEDKEQIKRDLEKIIDFCDQLKEVDTEGVEPLVYVSTNKNILREDVVKDPLPKEAVLKNAPSKDSDYFKVPKVIKK
jgi:aspartyl-tRNA(Asn)/glutamyl-tRNA(Gln) amidotransferase subunit C